MPDALVNETPLLVPPTLGDQTFRQLSGLLISGQIAPGERLSIREIAEAFGVSMTPVREAVSRLAATGALEVSRNRAATVPVMNVQKFRDITRVRIEIEGFAAALAAENRTAEDLKAIEAAEGAFRDLSSARPQDVSNAVQRNQQLHFEIYAAAHSPTLLEIVQALWLRVGPVLNLDLRENPDRLESGIATICHAEALDAIRNRDPAAARAAIARDIDAAARFIERQNKLPS
ncbi:GntR family transcriptional regulator [Stappia sp.]|jgi:DNA-binding GntR family transcriptional regulator|uniref:GntR family transcriptional regulator n=1 Tax=Stappia sp. TaxID=1870903 RepID=UPI003D0D12C8